MPICLAPMTLGDLITHLIDAARQATGATHASPIVMGEDDQPLRQIIVKHGMIYLSEDARPHTA